jgi:hypothetical protein
MALISPRFAASWNRRLADVGGIAGVMLSLRTVRGLGPLSWFVGALALACGCQPAGEPLVPVAGRVTLRGKPVTEGSISFRPDTNKANASLHHPTGRIEPDGTYRLYIREREGAPAGWYQVVVFVNEPVVDERGRTHPGMPKSLIDRRYNRPSDTPLAAEVSPDAPAGSYDFDLKPSS